MRQIGNTRTVFVYLAAVLDAWSRKVVGYAISRSMEARVAALKAAINSRSEELGWRRRAPPFLSLDADRAVQAEPGPPPPL